MNCAVHTRVLATALLAAWMAPAAGALSVGLHLTLVEHDGHDPHRAEHVEEIAHLIRVAAQAHRHATPPPACDLATRAEGGALTLKSCGPALSVTGAVVCPEQARTDPSLLPCSLRRGPPDPLFTSHCSLLL